MRFGIVHRVMSNALAGLGLLSLATSGELGLTTMVAVGVGFSASAALPERVQIHPRMRSLGVVASLALLLSQGFRLFLNHDPLQVAVEFAAALQVIRLATRRGAAHDQQIVLLALLHLVAGTVLGGGLAYGLCFVGFLMAAPGALVLSHLRREVEGNYRQGARDRTGLPVDVPRILRSRRVISGQFLLATSSLAVPIFVLTGVLFILFPRVGLSLLMLNHGRSERMVGFSDRVDLGKVGKLRSDPTIAARVYPKHLGPTPPTRIPLYLRGTAFDTYDGVSWSRNRSTSHRVDGPGQTVWVQHRSAGAGRELMTIDLEPINPPVVFIPAGVAAFQVEPAPERTGGSPVTVRRGVEGEFEYESAEERGIRYRLYAPVSPQGDVLTPEMRRRYLRLPKGLGEEVATLARDWAGADAAPFEAARAVEARLRNDYQYDLGSPSGEAESPLEDFLFVSKRGHCEFYSTSMAILLRTLGIPTRNVTGFIGGTFNRFGDFYAVRQGDAHSWVEVYLEERGWVRFDPTPVADAAPQAEITGIYAFLRDMVEAAGERWDRHVVGYDLRQQVGLLRRLRGTWLTSGEPGGESALRGSLRGVIAVALVLGSLVVIWWWRRRTREAGGTRLPEAGERGVNQRAVELYRRLEDAMRVQGVPRKPQTPPLAHARAVEALGYSIGPEVMQLTNVYLEARFGQRTLSDEEYQGYGERIHAIRRGAEERESPSSW